jgi:hypothetical protein
VFSPFGRPAHVAGSPVLRCGPSDVADREDVADRKDVTDREDVADREDAADREDVADLTCA